MKRDYNYQAFTPEEVEQGLLQDLLNYLLSYNQKCNSDYYDIHITSDGYCSIVEWTDVSYESKYGPEGKFEFVDSDQVIMIEKIFPDNHTELCYDEEDYQERLKEFLEKNPGWIKGPFGNWTNEIENEKFKKMLENPCNYCVDDANNSTMDCDTCPNRPLMWIKATKDESQKNEHEK